MSKKKLSSLFLVPVLFCCLGASSCEDNTSDKRQRDEQEKILSDGTSQVGMPAIKNFRERKLLKDIYELRDQTALTTYTYVFSELRGCAVLVGDSIGYGIPYSTQFTNPQKPVYPGARESPVIAQADPNALFSPGSAEGTWILLKNPHGSDVKPIYVEPRVIVSPFKLDESMLCQSAK